MRQDSIQSRQRRCVATTVMIQQAFCMLSADDCRRQCQTAAQHQRSFSSFPRQMRRKKVLAALSAVTGKAPALQYSTHSCAHTPGRMHR